MSWALFNILLTNLILCPDYKIGAFLIITPLTQLYVRIGILLTYGRLDDRVISLRGKVCAHKTS